MECFAQGLTSHLCTVQSALGDRQLPACPKQPVVCSLVSDKLE